MIAEPGAPSLHEQLPPHPGGRKRKAAPGDVHAFDDGTRYLRI
jgi:hypothetical protein